MTVEELIKELTLVNDKTKEVYGFDDFSLMPVLMVDELSDRVDINLGIEP
jgi:hypothetical protein